MIIREISEGIYLKNHKLEKLLFQLESIIMYDN